MDTALVQLSFALPSSEDPLCAALAHTIEYEHLHFAADDDEYVTFRCVLPADAHVGDVISISATRPNARESAYFVAHTLTQQNLDQHVITLTLENVTHSGEFVLQLMLHGMHATLKDSAQFDVSIAAQKSPELLTNEHAKNQGLRHYISNMGASLLAFF
ncbi:hypothetical protein CWC02_18930 [Pseudoalteromonas sp. S2721]|uniref:hypothetical protein n=1 Tax=Pseudoalteromonas sp. S2721 TaxID=579526 RepID=UPI00110A2314|nr:hypothetical protein [Pseudoalteromonas sp. S2721]TMP14262.1 hypothetical protein CWC02_18930 [Pseudoalteromonas sp. S2721]